LDFAPLLLASFLLVPDARKCKLIEVPEVDLATLLTCTKTAQHAPGLLLLDSLPTLLKTIADVAAGLVAARTPTPGNPAGSVASGRSGCPMVHARAAFPVDPRLTKEILMVSTILVVDDSNVDRCLIGGLLRNNPGYRVELVEGGKEALERVSMDPVDLVLTDLLMPEMDGLELVRAMRQQHPDVPVVLLTAHGNETIAVEALESGAASYVPKAQQAERLTGTVARVLERADADHRGDRLARCVLEYQWRLALENDPDLIRPLIKQVLEMMASVDYADRGERIRVGEALEQALLNAMYHGNLEIGENELAELRADFDDRRLDAFVRQRRQEPKYADRRILVVVRISPDEARFVIRDEGSGYRVSAKMDDATATRFESGQHRGLTLIQTLMDEVRFNERGNELTMSKLTAKQAAPCA
jgi:CheY-like chemotaxis protein